MDRRRSSRRCSTRASRARTRRAACSTCCWRGWPTRSVHVAGDRRARARTSGWCARGRRCATRSTSCAWSRWTSRARSRSPRRRAPGTESAVLREALALGRHFLGDAALPGALLSLLEATRRRRPGDDAADDGRRAGDDHRALRAAGLAAGRARAARRRRRCGAFFTSRVIGQPEAVECMVERVALLKAGLTDPTRPQAVLLFVGPTGTGKTEIAKALAEYLFGSRRPDDPARHERVPEPGLRAADARRRRARRRVAGRADPAPAVLGRAARRVREGRPGRLRPVPAGLRRRPPERPARRARGLPPRRDHHDLEPGREDRRPERARLLARDRVRRGQRRAGGHASRSGPSS